jgi:hypothetical protein
MIAASPVLLLLASWATLRGALTTAMYSLLIIATFTGLLTLPRAPLLIGIWLAASAVALAVFRRRPAFGLRMAAGGTAAIFTVLALLGV